MQVIRERLNQKDCITKGWVMIGFPRTSEQAESLARTPNIAPNRYVCFGRGRNNQFSLLQFSFVEFSSWIFLSILLWNV